MELVDCWYWRISWAWIPSPSIWIAGLSPELFWRLALEPSRWGSTVAVSLCWWIAAAGVDFCVEIPWVVCAISRGLFCAIFYVLWFGEVFIRWMFVDSRRVGATLYPKPICEAVACRVKSLDETSCSCIMWFYASWLGCLRCVVIHLWSKGHKSIVWGVINISLSSVGWKCIYLINRGHFNVCLLCVRSISTEVNNSCILSRVQSMSIIFLTWFLPCNLMNWFLMNLGWFFIWLPIYWRNESGCCISSSSWGTQFCMCFVL